MFIKEPSKAFRTKQNHFLRQVAKRPCCLSGKDGKSPRPHLLRGMEAGPAIRVLLLAAKPQDLDGRGRWGGGGEVAGWGGVPRGAARGGIEARGLQGFFGCSWKGSRAPHISTAVHSPSKSPG